MDFKIIAFISSIIVALFVTIGFNFKNDLSQKSQLDNILSEVVDENLNVEPPQELIKEVKTDIGNVLTKKTKLGNIYTPRNTNNKLLTENDAEGAFSYGNVQGLMKKGASWGRAGPDERSLISEPDIQSKYVYGLNKHNVSKQYDDYARDGPISIGDVPSARVKENFRYMRTAVAQMDNIRANSYKYNIDIDGGVGKEILTYSKSKFISPGFVSGYIESKNPINLNESVVPVYKDLPLDVNIGVKEANDSVNFHADNKLIFKI